ncbi:serine/threonine protein phosphatase [Escherichia coli]|uniref:serine/threonine protein phosphatase n=1 Tax=Escherichia coli TaxID=562 RepID=UPI000BB81D53|nr:serine/threonine protein phosphatase [Escherichia coli]
MNIYERIDGSKYRNIWVVGDLHGCYTNLMKKLETIGFDTKKDLLISVGDLVDRGTENVECLELITFPWFRAVRGNHEQMMIDGLSERGNVNHWLLNGGGWFFNLDYDKEILAKALAHKADELPLIIELVSKGKKYVICHADYPCDKYEFGKPVDHQQVIWNRERISNSQDGIVKEIKGYEFGKPVDHQQVIWNRERISNSQDGIVKEIKGADTFIFGHTQAVKPLKFANQMYIDTGAVFCGNLTLIQVQGEGAWA